QEHPAVVADQVEIAFLILAEAGDRQRSRSQLLAGEGGRVVAGGDAAQPEHPSAAEVPEQVGATQRRVATAAVDVAAGHRAAEVATVLADRKYRARAAAATAAALAAFEDAPAIVAPAGQAPGLEVDLLGAALADIGDPQVAGVAVEA